jgi:hypothetical protein
MVLISTNACSLFEFDCGNTLWTIPKAKGIEAGADIFNHSRSDAGLLNTCNILDTGCWLWKHMVKATYVEIG